MQPADLKKVCVLGGGAFGTALAMAMARKGGQVTVWHMSKKDVMDINAARENVHFLRGIRLLPNIEFTDDVTKAMDPRDLDLILIAIPTQFVRGFFRKNKALLTRGVPLVLCCKGIEIATLKTPYDVMLEELEAPFHCNVCVLAGPSFAHEIGEGLFTSFIIAAKSAELAHRVQCLVTSKDGMFRAYGSSDVLGCEIASAVKNVIAIASGICQGLKMKLNARAALICRGISEIKRLAKAMGSTSRAINGLAGVGDLLLTCSSEMSRNFSVGYRIGRGEALKDILGDMKAYSEGVPTAKAVHLLCQKHNVNMPICREVYLILYEQKNVQQAFKDLLSVPLADEGGAAQWNNCTPVLPVSKL